MNHCIHRGEYITEERHGNDAENCPRCLQAALDAANQRAEQAEAQRDALVTALDCGDTFADAMAIITDYLHAYERLAGVEKMAIELDRLRARCERLAKALQEIKDRPNQVCAEYETCKHSVCESSYAAFAIADEALKG